MTKLKAKHLYDLVFVSDPQLAPDGERAVAVHTVTLPGEDGAPPRYRGNIHLYELATGSARQLSTSSHGDRFPRFSPDGTRLAFLGRKREEDKPQLYLLEFAGGEARQLTRERAGVESFVWHPSGERLAYVSRGDWQRPSAKETTQRVIERSWYLSDAGGFRPEVPAQIYLLDLSEKGAERLTDLKHDPSGLEVSPDGRTLYFAASPDEAVESAWRSQLYALKLRSGKLRSLLETPLNLSQPSLSPDGKWLAFFAPQDPEDFASPTSLWRVPSRGGEPERLTSELEAAPSIGGDSRYGDLPNRARWTPGGALVLNTNAEAKSLLSRLEPKSGELTGLVGGLRAITSFDAREGTLLYTAETPERPGELFVWQDGTERQLSNLNGGFAERHGLRPASELQSITTADGARLGYWTLEPAKPRADGALIVQVHGGPHTNYGYGFYLEFQLLAAAGYTVVYGNPRGGSSFGHDFATTILGRYGSVDADDVLAIAEHAARARSKAQGKTVPIHLTGGSYGGFMTNWLVTQTDRFRSAVTQRSICNWLSFYGTSDIGERFTEREQGGTPWKDFELLWRQSPLAHVERVTTPLLILHSEADYRCPIEQAEQFFAALKRLGRAETRFVRFPEENHELSRSGRPDRRVARLEVILGWFQAHA